MHPTIATLLYILRLATVITCCVQYNKINAVKWSKSKGVFYEGINVLNKGHFPSINQYLK